MRFQPDLESSFTVPGETVAKGRALLTSGLGRWLGVALFFSLAAVVQTWPLVIHVTKGIIGTTSSWGWSFDTFAVILWSQWWVKHALVDLHTNPFHTDLLYFPQGSNLYLHTLGTLNGVISIPFQVVSNNLLLSWNIVALTSFVLSGMGMYALSYQLTRNHTAALVSGYIFAFAPFVFVHITSHGHLSTTWPIPLFVLSLIRLQDTGRLREAIAAAISWALLTYNNLEYAVDAALFLALFVTYWSFVYLREKEWVRLPALWRGSVFVGVVWLAVSAPLLIGALRDIYGGGFTIPGNDEYWSADLVSFVTASPLWGPGMDIIADPAGVKHVPIGAMENTVYLGITPLLLAGLAILFGRRRPQRVLFWGIVFLLFAIMALGPYLYVHGTKTVPLPYQILDQIPLVGDRRAPTRMIVFGIVGLAVLAGVGFDLLTSWLRQNYRKIVPLAGLLLFGFVVLEYWNPPVQISELARPALFEQIREEPGDFSVLHAPWGRLTGFGVTGDYFGGPLANYYQTIDERPAFGGLLSRAEEKTLAWVGHEPGLHYLACLCADRPDDMNPDLVRGVFRQYRIRYVVIDKLDPRGLPLDRGADTLRTLDIYLTNVVGLTPFYEDPSFTVYRNPQVVP